MEKIVVWKNLEPDNVLSCILWYAWCCTHLVGSYLWFIAGQAGQKKSTWITFCFYFCLQSKHNFFHFLSKYYGCHLLCYWKQNTGERKRFVLKGCVTVKNKEGVRVGESFCPILPPPPMVGSNSKLDMVVWVTIVHFFWKNCTIVYFPL